MAACDARGRAAIPHGIPDAGAAAGKELLGYLEVHIEQGPVLLQEGLPVGIVTAIAGTVRCMVTISGTAGHAGTVPMARRHDAAAAAAELVLYVEQRCAQAPTLVGTVGQLAVPNGAINVIPGRCELTLDIRAADDATRDAAVADVMRGDRADRAEARRRHREQGSPARLPRCPVRRGCNRCWPMR